MKNIWHVILAFLLALYILTEIAVIVKGQERDPFAALVTVERHDTYDTAGVQFYFINLPGGGRCTISIDKDLALAKWLNRRADKRRMSLSLSE